MIRCFLAFLFAFTLTAAPVAAAASSFSDKAILDLLEMGEDDIAAFAMWRASAYGGHDQVWRFGPPLASLISETRCQSSARLQDDIARKVNGLMDRWTPALQADWTRRSCAAASRLRTGFR